MTFNLLVDVLFSIHSASGLSVGGPYSGGLVSSRPGLGSSVRVRLGGMLLGGQRYSRVGLQGPSSTCGPYWVHTPVTVV